MPIKGMSDLVRLPRLGKIRLGMKVTGTGKNPYPKALDYFNCPAEVQAVFGEKPKELEIMFPSEDPELFAPQYLRCYSQTQGLVCIGDGEVSRRKVDLATGAIAGHQTETWEWKEGLHCDPQECPEFLKKRCRRVMNLLVLIPSVPGLGVWQIDTSSFYSIVNTNSIIKMLKELAGRCSFIPLTLNLGPIEVSPPGTRKKRVHVISYTQKLTLAEIAGIGIRPAMRALLPEPDTDEVPEDLFPPELLEGEAEVIEEEEPPLVDQLFPPKEEVKPHDQVQTIRILLAQIKGLEKSDLSEFSTDFLSHIKERYGAGVIEELSPADADSLIAALEDRKDKALKDQASASRE